jgi:hypothetical protein
VSGSVIYVFVLCVGERNVNLCGDFSELARKRLKLWVCQGVTLC